MYHLSSSYCSFFAGHARASAQDTKSWTKVWPMCRRLLPLSPPQCQIKKAAPSLSSTVDKKAGGHDTCSPIKKSCCPFSSSFSRHHTEEEALFSLVCDGNVLVAPKNNGGGGGTNETRTIKKLFFSIFALFSLARTLLGPFSFHKRSNAFCGTF